MQYKKSSPTETGCHPIERGNKHFGHRMHNAEADAEHVDAASRLQGNYIKVEDNIWNHIYSPYI